MTPTETNLRSLFEETPELDINVHDYNINVTSNEGSVLNVEEVLTEFAEFDGAAKPAHLYYHLPLCDYICHFCNYVKKKIRADSRQEEVSVWANNLIRESQYFLDRFDWISQAQIRSFYIGGGTGALLLNNPGAARRLIRFVDASYDMSGCVERSIEGNPENFTTETLSLAKELGFNRFSVGVQSLQNEVNEFANRGHSVAEALRAIDVLLTAGAPFSVDLMFGLPHQTVASAAADVERLISLGVPAITIYRLRNAERERMGIGNASAWNNPRARERLDSSGSFPTVLETYAMRDRIAKLLLEHGYYPSPCGWWNRTELYPDGNIPRVSKDKWQHYHTMLAYGPGAYGWLSGDSPRTVQLHNNTKIGEYEAMMAGPTPKPGLAFGRLLEGNRAIGTRLGFAYKANQPISVAFYRSVYGINLLEDEPYAAVLHELIEKGFLERNGADTLKPTLKGEMVHEEVMYVYFHRRIGGSILGACATMNGTRGVASVATADVP